MPFIKIATKSKNVLAAIIVKRETVGQYTGLTDKNGKKIFEGDIVAGPYLYSKGICIFKHGSYWLQWLCDGDDTSFSIMYNVTLEVIGNIHDNPELIEQPHE